MQKTTKKYYSRDIIITKNVEGDWIRTAIHVISAIYVIFTLELPLICFGDSSDEEVSFPFSGIRSKGYSLVWV